MVASNSILLAPIHTRARAASAAGVPRAAGAAATSESPPRASRALGAKSRASSPPRASSPSRAARAVRAALVAMGLVVVWAGGAMAQTFSPADINSNQGTQTAPEGTIGADGMLTLGTVTLQATISWNQNAVASYEWSQISAATFDARNQCRSSVALPSSDPAYVALSGATGSLTTGSAAGAVAIGAPSFTAPDVAATERLYFGAFINFSGLGATRCYFLAVDVTDVEPPTVRLTAFFDGSVRQEGSRAHIRATASDPDGSNVFTFLVLTSTTGPTPRFNWLLQPLLDENGVQIAPAHSTTFIAPIALADYTLEFTVTARDAAGLTSMDTVTLNVMADANLPRADAGPDQTVDEADTPAVTLGGFNNLARRPNTRLTGFQWEQISGPTVNFVSGSNIPRPSFRLSELTADATLQFRLTVTDSAGGTGTDTVTITATAMDDAPTVSAGDNQRVMPGWRVVLIGRFTDDGARPTLEWTQTGPTSGMPPEVTPTVTLTSLSAVRASFIAPAVTEDTTLTFQLEVTEAAGAMRSVTDTVDVVVSTTTPAPVPPSLPVFEVNAGTDQTVAGGAMVALDGSGSRADTSGLGLATATDWTWTQESGPTVTLAMPCVSGCDAGRTFDTGEGPLVNHLRPTFTAPAATATPQRLEFKLSRTQGLFTRSDTVHVTVTGTDSTAAVPTVSGVSPSNAARSVNTSVTITATTAASSPTWQWWQISGMPVTLSGDTTASITFTTPATAQSGPDQFLRFAVAVTSGGVTSAPRGALITVNANNGGPEGPSSDRRGLAGADRTVAEGASTTLGADLRDPQSDTFTVQWTQYGGPPVALSDPTAEQPTFTAPTNLVATTFFYYWVVATDEHGAANSDQVRIQVDGANGLPTVDIGIAGGELRADEGSIVTLTPTITDDEGIAAIQWAVETATFIYTPDIFLTPLNTGRLRFVMPNAYANIGGTFRITVTDLHGATATDTVTIFLNSGDNDEPSAVTCLLPKIRYTLPADPSTTVDRVVPGASCSSGQEVESGASVTLEGRDSSDPEGETLTYAWEQLTRTVLETATTPTPGIGDDGNPRDNADSTFFSYAPIAQDDPNRVTLTGATTAQPTFTAPTATSGDIDLYFRLTVTEVISESVILAYGQPQSDSAITTVVVRARPVVDAGGDQISHEGQTVTLDGSGSAPSSDPGDTGALTYAWSQTAGTPAVTLSDAAAVSPTFTVPALSAETRLTFRLMVTDSMGNSGTDDVSVRLLPVFNVAVGGEPTAGEGESVSLSARFSGENIPPTATRTYTYAWEQTSGPDVLLPTGANARTFLFRAPTPLDADATATFRLSVTAADDLAAEAEALGLRDLRTTKTATLSVAITRDTTGTRPTVAAGDDVTVAAGRLVRLRATASGVPAGAAVEFFWTQTSGPSVAVRPRSVNAVAGTPGSFVAEADITAPLQAAQTLTFSVAAVSIVNNVYLAGTPDTVDVVTAAADPPLAKAGDDVTVDANAAVMLSGAAQSLTNFGGRVDYNGGENLLYTWEQLPPPPAAGGQVNFVVPVTLANADTQTASFTAPSLPIDDVLEFRLEVRGEASGLSTTDVVRVFVRADPAYADAGNRAPIAHAGADMRVLSGARFTLDGRLSGDADYAGLDRLDAARPALGYQWTQISGPAATGSPGGPTSPSLISLGAPVGVATDASAILNAPANTGSTAVEMVFRLVVTDGQLFSAPDEVVVTVLGNSDASLQSLTVLLDDTFRGASDAATPGEPVLVAGAVPVSPALAPGTTAYSVTISDGYTGIFLTAVPNARGETTAEGGSLTGATVAVTATDASSTALTPAAAFMSSGEQFSVQKFTTGANTVTITVTAPDGTTTTAYTLTVNRAAGVSTEGFQGLYLRAAPSSVSGNPGSPNPRLHAGQVALNPAFATTTLSYTAQVPNEVDNVLVAWRRSFNRLGDDDSTATIMPSGGTATSCTIDPTVGVFTSSGTLRSGRRATCALEEGENTLTLETLPAVGGTCTSMVCTYTVTITRAAAATDATLSALAVSGLLPDVRP
ncbi:MAG: cadherin-like beta sandwich domain-containing protein, partial [Deltaproteobacteria bacterium]|nr:cadherin-like beta sandwich domain-containing protein [Deltaproteobacteria bacterium]